MTIGHLPQEPNSNPASTILKEALTGRIDLVRMEEKIDKLLSEITKSSDSELMHQYEELEAQYKNSGGYTLKAKKPRKSSLALVLMSQNILHLL